ncbi:E3 ubiquitin-protein ligase RNF12-B [Brachionichthys hirsutus]|uniref:E3 ubiquitin-protein ligase RNF12-B n=1 Tax=Brachionichthys hirsutus TaxID=412623 RepID=UPI003604AA7B
MGAQISRKRDIPANAAETAAVAEEQTVTPTREVDVKEGAATSAPVADAESEPAVSEGSPPESESLPAPEAEPVPEPVNVPEPEPASDPEPEVEPVLEAVSESAPAGALKEQTDMLAQESVPESAVASPALIDLGIADAAPQLVNAPPSPSPGCAGGVPVVTESQAAAEASTTSEETSESVEQFVPDVREENVTKLLQNVEQKENELVADLISAGAQTPDATPIAEVNPPDEQM